MAILLTGGTGKTSIPLAYMLQDAKVPFLLASRKGPVAAPSGLPATKFDWLDSSTHENPFQHRFPNDEKISAVYLIAPEVMDPAPSMISFIDLAVKKYATKRFVLLTGSSTVRGGAYVGPVWQHLVDIGVEYCVLLATWFMENFLERQHLVSIKQGKIYTACADGKIPFVSAKDIAAVAFHGLTDRTPHNTDYRVLGPELLTYDQIAAKLTRGLGRETVHVRLAKDERIKKFQEMGMPEHFAHFLAGIEVMSANGGEERMNDAVERVTGRPPMNFDDWVQENKTALQ